MTVVSKIEKVKAYDPPPGINAFTFMFNTVPSSNVSVVDMLNIL